jgi:hypothetical protein
VVYVESFQLPKLYTKFHSVPHREQSSKAEWPMSQPSVECIVLKEQTPQIYVWERQSQVAEIQI